MAAVALRPLACSEFAQPAERPAGRRFAAGTTSHSLTQYSFPPTSGAGDFLVAAMQLNGDSAGDPYAVYYDNCHFYWA